LTEGTSRSCEGGSAIGCLQRFAHGLQCAPINQCANRPSRLHPDQCLLFRRMGAHGCRPDRDGPGRPSTNPATPSDCLRTILRRP
jgi:hypothetical protein